jgi:hypothetical protein
VSCGRGGAEKNLRTRVHGPFTGTGAGSVYDRRMKAAPDEPLPATLVFVFALGALIAVGWFAMYVLLRARW